MGMTPHFNFSIDIEKFSADFTAIETMLMALQSELEGAFDLIPDHPVTQLAIELMDVEMTQHFEEIKRMGRLKASTIKRRRRGGLVRVTDSGKMPYDRSSTETGKRTGWLMRHFDDGLRPQDSETALEGYGYRFFRAAFGHIGSISELQVYLDTTDFYNNYPMYFDKWLQEKINVGLIDLTEDAKIRVLNGLMQLMSTRVDKILRGGV